MPSRVIDTTPSTMKLMMTIVAKTGRLIEVSEIHMKRISAFSDHDDRDATAWRYCRIAFTRASAGSCRRASAMTWSPARRPGHDLDPPAVVEPFDHGHGRDLVAVDLEHDALAVARRDGFARHASALVGGWRGRAARSHTCRRAARRRGWRRAPRSGSADCARRLRARSRRAARRSARRALPAPRRRAGSPVLSRPASSSDTPASSFS